MQITLTDFAQKVKAMREEQKAYFRTRSSSSLNKAKTLESQVDQIISQLELPEAAKQKGMFD